LALTFGEQLVLQMMILLAEKTASARASKGGLSHDL
jgi:hypothetical protein